MTAIAGPANGTGIGFALALNPTTAEQAMKTAEWMSKSDLVPKGYHGKPHDIVIAAAMGARLGLDPFSALAGIAVVNGRPTLWGDAMLAVCQQRPDWGGMTVEWDGDADALACTVTIMRKGHGPYASTFGIADAKTAGLWKKQGPWTQYPRRMLELRARSYALRGAFADALAGFHAREEVDDEPKDAEVMSVRDAAASPAPAKRRTAPEPAAEEPAQAPQEPERHPEADDMADVMADAMRADERPVPPVEAVQALIDEAVREFGDKTARGIMAPIAGMVGVKRIMDCPEERRAELVALMGQAIEKAREQIAAAAARDMAAPEGGEA